MSTSTIPDVLVSTDWLAQHMTDPKVRIVEISVDSKLFAAGHIPGAVDLNWTTQLQDQLRRDIVSSDGFAKLLSAVGISNDDTVVLYGDHSNWFAAYAFWLFKLYGHADVRILNGGRAKWLNEPDRPLTTETTTYPPTTYKAKAADNSLRALLPEVLQSSAVRATNLIDVRSVDEFTGKVIAPPGMSETAQRAGHIPGAANVPWSKAANEDGTFRSIAGLKTLYLDQAGVKADKPTITYCRIGERSSHTWFVLKYLLGLSNVKNYDGSWTEYGSVIGVPIEK